MAEDFQRLTPGPSRQGIAWDVHLQTAAQKIFDQAYADVAQLGGVGAYGSPGWVRAWQANGAAWSIGSTLPFPDVAPFDFPMPQEGPAPGEIPFDQCANYRPDGESAIGHLKLKYANAPAGAIVSGGLTLAELITNTMISYNDEAARFGCRNVPFPEAAGLVPKPENYAPVPVVGPPVNTFTPEDGGPPVVLVDDGSNVPTGDPAGPPPPPPLPIPDPTPTPPGGGDSSGGPDAGGPSGGGPAGPVGDSGGGGSSTPAAAGSGSGLLLVAGAAALVLFLSKRKK